MDSVIGVRSITVFFKHFEIGVKSKIELEIAADLIFDRFIEIEETEPDDLYYKVIEYCSNPLTISECSEFVWMVLESEDDEIIIKLQILFEKYTDLLVDEILE